MAGGNSRDPRAAGIRRIRAARDDARGLAEGRPEQLVRMFLPPFDARLRAINAQREIVLVTGRDPGWPKVRARAVLVAQQHLCVSSTRAARNEGRKIREQRLRAACRRQNARAE